MKVTACILPLFGVSQFYGLKVGSWSLQDKGIYLAFLHLKNTGAHPFDSTDFFPAKLSIPLMQGRYGAVDKCCGINLVSLGDSLFFFFLSYPCNFSCSIPFFEYFE